jgi:LacI family transcriptional regulator/LacI family repressor for deo operon, udp, cdd, tsx, nupC, and nupG
MEDAPAAIRHRAPTIRDVARHAGVSVATVSRVLNDIPIVRSEMRARVVDAIAELGYRPSSTARSLSLGRSQAIGVVAPFFTTPSVVERVRGVAECAARHGYDLMLFHVETPEQRTAAFRDFARHDRVDGLLVISLRVTAQELAAMRGDRLPIVMVDSGQAALPHVVIDDVRGGQLAAEHLLARGHRRIGFIGDVPAGPLGFTSSEDRRRGFRLALLRAGIPGTAALEVRGPHGREDARRLAAPLLRRDDPPTAVFAASDTQAIGVLEAAEAAGLRVPDDLAVMGFDDIEVAALLGLTTVRQPLRQSGAHGADLLVAAIEGRPAPVAQLDALTVMERRTT